MALVLLGPYFAKTMREMLLFYIGPCRQDRHRDRAWTRRCRLLRLFRRLTLPLAGVAVIGAIFSNVLQVGLVFSVKPITPDFSKIVPRFGQYFKRTMFSLEGVFNLAKSIAKIFIIAFVAYLTIQGEFDRLRRLFEGPFWPMIAFVFSLAMRLIIEVAVAMLILAVPDYLFQRRQYMESLKMSKEEVKEERKMQEGDPLIKSRLRERMRELLARNMAANVPKADVVITNPTHYAVALEWDREKMPAPTVSAKGVGRSRPADQADRRRERRPPGREQAPRARAIRGRRASATQSPRSTIRPSQPYSPTSTAPRARRARRRASPTRARERSKMSATEVAAMADTQRLVRNNLMGSPSDLAVAMSAVAGRPHDHHPCALGPP